MDKSEEMMLVKEAELQQRLHQPSWNPLPWGKRNWHPSGPSEKKGKGKGKAKGKRRKKRAKGQNQQQNAAILAQSGVAGTPYGAGVQQQANTNFNLGWENQALQRASTAEQGAGSLLGSIGQATNTGLSQMQTGAGLGYNTAQGITGNQLGLLGQAGAFGQSAAQLPQQQIADYLQYLQGATGQQGANNQTAGLGLQQAQPR